MCCFWFRGCDFDRSGERDARNTKREDPAIASLRFIGKAKEPEEKYGTDGNNPSTELQSNRHVAICVPRNCSNLPDFGEIEMCIGPSFPRADGNVP